jgi:CDP-glucose 4,6-dehydratase
MWMDSNLEPRVLNQATNEIKDQYLSSKKARNMLDWTPLYTMEEGLKDTVEWYRNSFHR